MLDGWLTVTLLLSSMFLGQTVSDNAVGPCYPVAHSVLLGKVLHVVQRVKYCIERASKQGLKYGQCSTRKLALCRAAATCNMLSPRQRLAHALVVVHRYPGLLCACRRWAGPGIEEGVSQENTHVGCEVTSL